MIIVNDKQIPIFHVGTRTLPWPLQIFQLKKVFHAPHLTTNLISVSKFCLDNNTFFEFHPHFFLVKDQATKRVLFQGCLKDGLYQFPTHSVPAPIALYSSCPANSLSTYNYYDQIVAFSRLGHPANNILQQTLKSCHIPFTSNKDNICCVCQYAKSHKLQFSLSESRSSHPLALIHTDLWGPAPIPSTTGAKYFLLLIDDYSRFSWIYPLHTKYQALPTFVKFKTLIENQLNTRIKCLQSDNGGEFLAFHSYLTAHGIPHRFSCPKTPKQNERAERKIRHLVETGLSLLAHASLPLKSWHYDFQTAVFLINRMSTRVLHLQSPFQVLFRQIPNYSQFKVFLCLCYPYIPPYNQHKLSYRSVNACFLAIVQTTKVIYICLDHTSNRMYITRHVVFHESIFPFRSSTEPSQSTKSPSSTPAFLPTQLSCSNIQAPISKAAFPSSIVPAPSPTTSTSIPELVPMLIADTTLANSSGCPPPLNNHPMVTRAKNGISKKKALLTQRPAEPCSYSQAAKDPNWYLAMEHEFHALKKNNTWCLVPVPSHGHVISCKWVYKLKYKPDGSMDRYKARLVARV